MADAKFILIVDDDGIVAQIYQRQFLLAGYQAKVVLNGEQALEFLKERRPDLVLLDLQMPKVNGIEVLRAIRANPALKTLPVVVFSNAYLGNLVQEAWKAGANKCLTKAISTPRSLLEVIRATLADGPGSKPPVSKADIVTEDAPSDAASITAELRSSRRPSRSAASSSVPVLAETDTSFEAKLKQEFLASGPVILASLRSRIQALAKTESDTGSARWLADRSAILFELYQLVHTMTGSAGAAGLQRIATMASAFEALLRELHEKPKNINPSTIRTVANVVDFFGTLFTQAADPAAISVDDAAILVVDDDPISRRAVLSGLEKAGLKGTAVGDPLIALAKLAKNRFDLVFLDVQMPGMNGFELCTKLRTMPLHTKTPVVFVTAMTDFQSRARSTLSGGNDLIAKPFLMIELAVKALTFVLRGRAQPPA